MSTLHLEIVTIERKVFAADVNMVVAPGSEGVMGILPHHTPLLTALSYGELQIKRDGQEDEFYAIGGGFMEVQPDHVIVMADSAEHGDEIDLARAEASRKRAEERMESGQEELVDFEKAEAALRRSALRIKVASRRRRKDGYARQGPPSVGSSS